MNRRKRNRDDTNSLDLLLDALCNMFGGIIFIALLIVLITSEATQTKEKNKPASKVSIETRILDKEAKSFEEKLDLALKSDLSSRVAIYRVLEILEQAKSQRAESLNVLDKDEQQTNAENQAELDALTELDRLVSIRKELQDKLESPNQSEIVDAIEVEQAAIRKVQKQINSIDQRNVLHARLPRERQSNLTPVWIILEHNKAYIAMSSDGSFDNFDHRDVQATPTSHNGFIFTPLQNGGFQINKSISLHPRFRDLLNDYSKSKYLIKMLVRSNAHEAFQHFKAALNNNSYSYNLLLTEEDLALYPTGSPDRSIQ